jgi:hypothetical protein
MKYSRKSNIWFEDKSISPTIKKDKLIQFVFFFGAEISIFLPDDSTRYSLYLFWRTSPQQDAASIGAK